MLKVLHENHPIAFGHPSDMLNRTEAKFPCFATRLCCVFDLFFSARGNGRDVVVWKLDLGRQLLHHQTNQRTVSPRAFLHHFRSRDTATKTALLFTPNVFNWRKEEFRRDAQGHCESGDEIVSWLFSEA